MTSALVHSTETTIANPATFRALVTRVIQQAGTPDPREIAGKILAELSDDECRAALAVTLPEWVRHQAGEISRQTRGNKVMVSGRAQRINNWWSKTLSQGMFTGSEWKFFGDFTADDLHGSAAERFQAATRTQTEGERLLTLAEHMEKKKYKQVRDIPEADLRTLLGAS